MPDLSLDLSNPKVVFGDSEYIGREDWVLSFDARLSNWQSRYPQRVELTSEEGELKNLHGTVHFESTSKEAYRGFQKGALVYWEGFDDGLFYNPPK